MSQHTPTPWAVHGDNETMIGASDNRQMLAQTLYAHIVPEWERDLSEAQANAAFIVRACNAHDELLAACSEFLRVIDALREVNVLGDWPVVRETLPAMRDAIAKAKGESA